MSPRRVLAALFAVLALAGCSGIPHDGPVVPGRPAANDPREGLLEFKPELPAPGAPPEDTVVGFILAASGFNEDHRVARSFLAPARRLSWRPDASVVVYPGASTIAPKLVATPSAAPTPTPSTSPAPRDAQRATVVVTVPVEATIDGDGRYLIGGQGQTEEVEYGLVRVNGDWRIDQVPDGILISGGDFAVTFRAFPVYFPDKSGSYLVPDVHWFPGGRDVQTALVRALLRGPAEWLSRAVTTGAPVGTRMAVSSVVIANEVATVDLSEQARSANPRDRQLLLRQLQATLGRLNVESVRITVEQADFEVPAGDVDEDGSSERGPSGPAGDPSVDPRPVVLNSAGAVARLEGGRRVEPVSGVEGLIVEGSSHPAVNSGGNAFAVLGQDRGELLTQLPGSKAAEVVLRGRRLTPPSFDPLGWLWSTPAAADGEVTAYRAEQETVKVRAPWLRGFDVVALRASRDGARMLVAAEKGGAAYVWAVGVVREEDGRPTELTEAPALVPDMLAITDAAWVDEDQVVVLGRRAGPAAAEQPWIIQIGGRITSTSPANGALSISAGNGELALVAGTARGILARAGKQWEPVADARWPAYPG